MSRRDRAVVVPTVLLVVILLGVASSLVQVHAAPDIEEGVQEVVQSPLPAGSDARVSTTGSCLNLRDAPSLDGSSVQCLSDGARVTVLDGQVEADGHTWQQVQWNSETGWVAASFLRSAGSGASGGSCQSTHNISAGFNGGLHTGGGISMVQWGGGTIAGMQNRATAEGCDIRSTWATHEGRMYGYITGAPDFVNVDFFELYPNGYIPAGDLLIVDCQPHGGNIGQQAATMAPPPNGNAPQLTGSDSEPPSISASNAVVIDGDSGAMLWDKGGFEPRPPASLTKIVTAIIAIEGADLDTPVTTDVDARNMPGSSVMGLRAGDCFPLLDLLYGLMLPSGNDAALAIGRFMTSSDETFVHHMNTLADRLAMQNSTFTDAHGLGSSSHRMSAYDIALASRYGMTLPAFREIVNARNWVANGSREITLHNVNSFLTVYPDSDGVKTGYTGSAGRTLAATATRDGQRLFAVVLNAEDRHQDAAKLLDWAFDNHSWN